MWKITTRGFTLHEILVMAATNVASVRRYLAELPSSTAVHKMPGYRCV